MKTWMKVLAVTVLVAAPAMILGPVVWPPADFGPEPTGSHLPFFLLLALMEPDPSRVGDLVPGLRAARGAQNFCRLEVQSVGDVP